MYELWEGLREMSLCGAWGTNAVGRTLHGLLPSALTPSLVRPRSWRPA